VDRLPSFHFDLDFLDRRGQVILPVESSIVLIDARSAKGAPRPVSKIVITQILDDREAASGKLTLDIRATARGVLPELKDLLEMDLVGFTIAKTNDSGSSLSKLDTESDDLAALSERSWVFNLEPAVRGKVPLYSASQTKSKDFELSYKRYADADLVEVKPELAIAGLRLKPDLTWLWLLLAGVVVAGGGVSAWIFRRRHAAHSVSDDDSAYALPAKVTPFTALSFCAACRATCAFNYRPTVEANSPA
jgi:hypothetical protein